MELELNNEIEEIKNSSQQKFITTKEGTKISFRLWGDHGPTLVLLHGGYGSWLHWLKNIEELSKDFQLIIPDMPGFGDSEALPELPNVDKYAKTIFTALKGLINDRQFNIVGFSFGSVIGSHMMKFAGDQVNRLTLVGYNRTGNMPFKRPQMKNWRAATTKDELFEAQRYNLSVMMIHKLEKIDEQAITIQTLNTRGGKVRSLDIVASHDLPHRLLGVTQPIDIIWGEFDVTLINGYDDAHQVMTTLIPSITCHQIKNSGHWIQFEEAKAFNKILKEIYL
ncbi:MAG: alpha/beta fold hydrolase [Hyphomicrobiales bacterium]